VRTKCVALGDTLPTLRGVGMTQLGHSAYIQGDTLVPMGKWSSELDTFLNDKIEQGHCQFAKQIHKCNLCENVKKGQP
jgi:hypothetical protein